MTNENPGVAGGDTPEQNEAFGKPTSTAPAIAVQVFGALTIEHASTDDALDGQPWPPTTLMDGWHLIRSLPGGQTLWRRITLK